MDCVTLEDPWTGLIAHHNSRQPPELRAVVPIAFLMRCKAERTA